MKACKFTFADEQEFEGFAVGTTWNGFDNVRVTPETFEQIKAYFSEVNGPEDHDPETWSIPVGEDGLVDLSNGFATQIVGRLEPDERQTQADLARELGDPAFQFGSSAGSEPQSPDPLALLKRIREEIAVLHHTSEIAGQTDTGLVWELMHEWHAEITKLLGGEVGRS